MSIPDNSEDNEQEYQYSQSHGVKENRNTIVVDKTANRTSKIMILAAIFLLILTCGIMMYLNSHISLNLEISGKITEGIIIDNTQINYWVNDMNPQRITKDFISYYYYIGQESIYSSYSIRFDKFEEYSEFPFTKGDTVFVKYHPKITQQSRLLNLQEIEDYTQD